MRIWRIGPHTPSTNSQEYPPPPGENHSAQLKHFSIRTCSSKQNLLNKMEEFQRYLRVAGTLSKNLRKLICLCNALWKLKEGMAPTSWLDAGRKARLFDMKRPVVHTRNNYVFKGEHGFFSFINQGLIWRLLVMHTPKMPNQIFDFFYNALKKLPG